MRLTIKAALVCFAPQIFIATPALSADFGLVESRYGYPIVILDGPIEQGDAERFRAIMQEAILTLGIDRLVVSLDSPGGNVGEAIEIGRIVRATLSETWTTSTTVWPRGVKGEVEHLRIEGHKQAFADLGEPLPALSKCWSACTIIFFSGVDRAVFDNRDSRANGVSRTTFHPTIGVHRPSYAPEEYGQLSPTEAQKSYDRMLNDMADALAGFGAPDKFILRTMATPSREIDLIPNDEMERLAADTEPFFDDWLAARCGRATDILADQEEHGIYGRYRKVWATRLAMEMSAEILAWDEDVALVEEFGLIDAVRAKTIHEKVRNWGRWVDLCAEIAVRTVRHEWATEAR